jgi:hypothetical protein
MLVGFSTTKVLVLVLAENVNSHAPVSQRLRPLLQALNWPDETRDADFFAGREKA